MRIKERVIETKIGCNHIHELNWNSLCQLFYFCEIATFYSYLINTNNKIYLKLNNSISSTDLAINILSLLQKNILNK